jgi:hypothetical protein
VGAAGSFRARLARSSPTCDGRGTMASAMTRPGASPISAAAVRSAAAEPGEPSHPTSTWRNGFGASRGWSLVLSGAELVPASFAEAL